MSLTITGQPPASRGSFHTSPDGYDVIVSASEVAKALGQHDDIEAAAR